MLLEEKNAKGARFSSYAASRIALSFGILYPESFYRKLENDKHAAQGRIIFSAPFSSPDIYEGDIEASAKDTLLKKAEVNWNQKQWVIDARFHPDQVKHTKMHAVLSYVLRVGYFQLVGFLQSLLPFQRMIEGVELGKEESWLK